MNTFFAPPTFPMALVAAGVTSLLFSECARSAETVLLTQGNMVEILVPSLADGSDALTVADWTNVAAPPATTASTPKGQSISWLAGVTGVGYESSGTNYVNAGLISLDVESIMDDLHPTLYARIPFTVDGALLPTIQQLKLRMKYDDGYVAYLNGVPIASRNAPVTPAWNSTASANHDDGAAEIFEDEDVTDFANALVAGDNMLAIHGLNTSNTSSDFLILPELVADDTPPPPPLAWPNYQANLFASGFNRPTDIQHAGDGTGRLFVVERPGTIRIVNPDGSILPQDFLDISNRVTTGTNQGDERGFLGIAFPPDFAGKGEFYASYTGTSGSFRSVISRFKLDPNDPSGNTADAASEQILLTLNQPYGNHNGGQIRFGSDGFLYIGFGDGGSGGDPQDHAQNPNDLLGKMLRIHVDGVNNGYEIPADNPFAGVAGVREEIWALGMRNPWRWSFDRQTGDMWIADVGQNAFEEVSKVDAGSSNIGLNFGWNQFEGFSSYAGGGPLSPVGTEVKPVFDISQGPDFSVTGGFVYRGSLWPRMQGIYFFADYGSGRELGAQKNAADEWVVFPFQDLNRSISAWGEDEDGELYYVNIANGQMFKISDTRGADYMDLTDSGVDGAGKLAFTFVTEDGVDYELQTSMDLLTWIDTGTRVTASGTSQTFTDPDLLGAETRRYLRAKEVE